MGRKSGRNSGIRKELRRIRKKSEGRNLEGRNSGMKEFRREFGRNSGGNLEFRREFRTLTNTERSLCPQ